VRNETLCGRDLSHLQAIHLFLSYPSLTINTFQVFASGACPYYIWLFVYLLAPEISLRQALTSIIAHVKAPFGIPINRASDSQLS
jgi:hypothetical protein